MKSSLLVLFVALHCSAQLPKFLSDSVVTDSASGSSRKRRLTFNNSASSQSLTDFPVLIRVNSARISYSCMQPGGADIRSYDSDDVTPLKFEIEKWDASGESIIWVRVPQIDALSSTDSIIMNYCTGGGDGQNRTDTWDLNFAGVWHLSDFSDSTTNRNNGTNSGSTSATGKVGNSRNVASASSQFITAPTAGMAATQGTVEVWGYPTTASTGNSMFMVAHFDSGGSDDRIYLGQRLIAASNNFMTALHTTGLPFNDTGIALPLNNWSYCVLTWTGSGTFTSYYQGAVALTAATPLPSTLQSTITFGAQAGGVGFYWDGRLDEIRISNTPRSAQWIGAQYRSMNDTYVTFGDEY